jgi:hypothetical protein
MTTHQSETDSRKARPSGTGDLSETVPAASISRSLRAPTHQRPQPGQVADRLPSRVRLHRGQARLLSTQHPSRRMHRIDVFSRRLARWEPAPIKGDVRRFDAAAEQ